MSSVWRHLFGWPAAAIGGVAICVLAVAASVDAEPGRRGGGPGGPPGMQGRGPMPPPGGPLRLGMLLRMEEVREELGLTDEQMQQLREAGREMRARMGGRRGGERGERPPRGERPRPPRGEGSLGDEGPEAEGDRPPRPRGEGREEMRRRFRDRAEAMGEKVEERLAGILNEEQMTRLKQIDTQLQVRRQGARALTHGPLADELGVSEEQGDQLRDKAHEIRGALAQQIRDVTDASREELIQELTTEQQAKLDELMGEPFDMPPPPRMGRRFGPHGEHGHHGPPPPRGPRGPRRGGFDGPPPPPQPPE